MVRGLLVVLAALAAALAAVVALALPRVVDEPALRDRLVALTERSTGYRLDIRGAVRLELTPLPRLSVDRVAVDAPGVVRVVADRIDLDLALLPLLAGRVEPSGLRLVRPSFAVERLPPDLATVLAAVGRGVEVRAAEILDGRLELAVGLAPGWPARLDGLNASLAWDPERRGFALTGAARTGAEAVRLDLDLQPVPAAGPTGLRLDLRSGASSAPATLTFEGSAGPGGALAGKLRAGAPNGRLPGWLARAAGLAVPPGIPGGVELAGRLDATAARVALADLELVLAGNRLRGAFTLDRGAGGAAARRFDVVLEAPRAEVAPALEAALRELAASGVRPPPGTGGSAELRLASLLWRGGEVRALRVETAWTPDGKLTVPRLDATLPGATALRWTGKVAAGGGEAAPAGGAALAGAVSLQAGELRPLLRWLGVGAADLPAGGLTSLDLAAEAEAAPGRLALRAIDARLDATALRGSAALAVGARPSLRLDLAADRINAAVYAGERDRGWPGIDLAPWRDRLAAADLDLKVAVDRLSLDRWRGGRLALRARVEAGRVSVPELLLADPDGNRLRVAGDGDPARSSYALAVELAATAEALAAPWGAASPPALAGLGPVRLDATLRRDPDAATAAARARLAAAGLDASLDGTLGGPLDPGVLDLAGELAVADPAALLEGLGWPVAAQAAALRGGARSRVALRRNGGSWEVRLDGRVGASDLAARLATSRGERPFWDLELGGRRLDLDLAGLLYDAAGAALGFPAGRPWRWPGAWPRQPLRWGWLDGLDLSARVALEALGAGEVDLPGATLSASLREGRLAVTELALPLAGGTLAGTATLDRLADRAAVLGADLRLERARAERLAGLLAPGSGLAGEIDLGARLVGQGSSVADLIGTLAGEGEVALRRGRLGGIPFPPLEGADALLDPGLEVLALEGPLRVERGTVASVPPSGLALTYPGGEGAARLRFDLLSWLVQLEIEGRRAEPPGGGGAALRLIGAPGRLRAIPREPARAGR